MPRGPRVLHVHNTGGQATKLAPALRSLGISCDTVVFGSEFSAADASFRLGAPGVRGIRRQYLGMVATRFLKNYDVVHVHGTSLLYLGLDLLLARLTGKSIVVHYHGVELIRHWDPALARVIYGSGYRGLRRLSNGAMLWNQQRVAHRVLVSTPNLLRYAPKGRWIPQPIDTSAWMPVDERHERHYIRLLHAPSNRHTKGTTHLEEAVSRLQAEGLPLQLRILERVSQEGVRAELASADIFVDQLLVGMYGNSAIEAMACGVPTVAFVSSTVRPYLDDCPVVDATPRTIANVIRKLARDPARRKRLAQECRRYAERVHDVRMIAMQLAETYSALVRRERS